MPTINLAHERFIAAMKQHPSGVHAYQAAYPGTSYASAKAHAARLLKTPYIKQRLEAHAAVLDEQALEEARQVAIARLKDYYDSQAEFLRIIKGGLIEKTNSRGGNKLGTPFY